MGRFLVSILLGAVVTFGLFAFMAFLVNSDQVAPAEVLPDVIVDVAQLPEERPPEIKSPIKLTPPPAPEPMPRTLVPSTETGVDGDFDYGIGSSVKGSGVKNFTLRNGTILNFDNSIAFYFSINCNLYYLCNFYKT